MRRSNKRPNRRPESSSPGNRSTASEMLGAGTDCGVDKIVENIGSLPTDLFAETCQQILTQLQGRAQAIDVTEICERFQKAGIQLDLEAVQAIVKLLSFNFRSAARNALSAEQLIAGLIGSSSRWSKPALQVVRKLWIDQSTLVCAHQGARAMVGVGQLVEVRWRLGTAISSDTCRSLNSPYVCLLLKMADASGRVFSRSFEMTIPQFQDFFTQFREMAAVLETV